MRFQTLLFVTLITFLPTLSNADQHFIDFARVIDVAPIHTYSDKCHSHSNYRGHPKRFKKSHSQSNYSYPQSYFNQYDSNTHCDPKHANYRESQGFSVTYKYRGKVHHTTTRFHPGKRLKLAIHIKPLE